jgi:hypothetical protein
MLQPGSSIAFTVTLEDFTIGTGETQDFKVNYAFTYRYFDTTPIAPSSTLGFKVLQRFKDSEMGLEESFGKVFSYDLSLTNLYKEKGQGMTVAILRVPACLQVNFDHLE